MIKIPKRIKLCVLLKKIIGKLLGKLFIIEDSVLFYLCLLRNTGFLRFRCIVHLKTQPKCSFFKFPGHKFIFSLSDLNHFQITIKYFQARMRIETD